MSKAYSNRALPPGTVLREWRLEEVLGVGGFGIVYKGRGIYFDELVAIKEYFPSAISERAEDETVVPVDSNAEEVHALGLKKFVEEAKLLWNLSTPSRHPNIVSVRSLFEIHGTAYMVMDFEDGTALSKLLRNGIRFNEASLKKMVVPICEGLERAHRVGVLHRDIKPPNIIVNDDGRSVLIDFGSARFESGEATSTTVTFHTPPYAAIEQYVRTYPQGPWTDIYALGVVLYECVTGKKPAEVLERVHGDAGERLADGAWPGFSRGFLAAVDAAMALRPEDRPQSIAAWLTMLKDEAGPPQAEEADDDEDVTRVGTWGTDSPSILPVAPPIEGFPDGGHRIETGVPETPSKADFTARGKARKSDEPAAAAPAEPSPEPVAKAAGKDAAAAVPEQPATAPEKPDKAATAAPPAAPAASPDKSKDAAGKPAESGGATPAPAAKSAKQPEKGKAASSPKRKLVLAGVAGVAVLAGGALLLSGGGKEAAEVPAAPVVEAPVVAIDDTANVAQVLAGLAEQATKAGLATELTRLLALPEAAEGITTPPADGDLRLALANFTGAVAGDAQRRLRTLTSANTAANAKVNLVPLRERLAAMRKGAEAVSAAAEDPPAITATQEVITGAQAFNSAFQTAQRTVRRAAQAAQATATPAAAGSASPSAGATAAGAASPAPAASSSGGALTSATRSEFRRAVREGRGLVDQVVRLGRRGRPGSDATDAEREGYRIRQANSDSARRYDDYLDTLESAMRNTKTDVEGAQAITKAYQTRAYLRDLLRQSEQSLK